MIRLPHGECWMGSKLRAKFNNKKYELLNPLPDWCYNRDEFKEMTINADVIIDGNYYVSLDLKRKIDEKNIDLLFSSII
jgi:hypothetical protein